jgi:hypothetical protein
LYDGDSMLRYGPGFGGGETPVPAEAPAEPAAEAAPEPVASTPQPVFELSVADIETRARAMRAAHIAALIGRLWNRIEAWFVDARRTQDEAYLAQASDLADLEQRMRRLERRGLAR